MTRLFKTQSEDIGDNQININEFDGAITSDVISRVASMKESLNEDDMVEERDLIEKCAESKKTYLYSIGWDDESVSQLKEYAGICQCPIKGINNKDAHLTVQKEILGNIQKQASTQTEVKANPLSSVFSNVFHVNEEKEEPAKQSWEKLAPTSKVNPPSFKSTSSSVLGVKGGEDYNINPHLNVRRGQNSVTSPDAIKNIIDNKEKDVGQRLKEEAKQKIETKKAEKIGWEKKMVNEAKENFSAIPRGNVKLTEALNAQPGIRGEGAFKTLKEIPKQTDGEKIKGQNDKRLASIQREIVKDDKVWNKPQSQATHEISDIFTESLKKALKGDKNA